MALGRLKGGLAGLKSFILISDGGKRLLPAIPAIAAIKRRSCDNVGNISTARLKGAVTIFFRTNI